MDFKEKGNEDVDPRTITPDRIPVWNLQTTEYISGFATGELFLDQLSNFQLPNKHFPA